LYYLRQPSLQQRNCVHRQSEVGRLPSLRRDLHRRQKLARAVTKSSPRKRKAATNAVALPMASNNLPGRKPNGSTVGKNTSPMMSLESAAASLTSMKPKYTSISSFTL